MKRILASAIVLALITGSAQAQTTPQQREGHKKEYKMGYNQLNLSAEQKSRLQSINSDFRKQMEELKKQDQLTVAEMKEHRKELQQQHQSQIETVLTQQQKEQLAKIRSEQKAKYAGRDGRYQNRGEWQKELDLTDEQEQKVSKIRTDFRSKMEAVHNNNALTNDQKKDKMQELRKQQQEQLKTVLTYEQIEKMKERRKEHAPKRTK